MVSLLKKLIGSRNDRILKQYRKQVAQINALEPGMAALTDQELAAKTTEFRQRNVDGASLDDLLPEAFAVVREGSKRVFGMRHFDVQLLGAIALHNGKIAEMRTGEGKTLMATLAVYRSEEHTSELQSLMRNSYAVFCLKKKTQHTNI